MRFSNKLKEDLKAYFHKKYAIKLSDTEAGAYLESLGRLGLIALEALSRSPLSRSAEEGRGEAAGDSASVGSGIGGTQPVAQCPQSASGDLKGKQNGP